MSQPLSGIVLPAARNRAVSTLPFFSVRLCAVLLLVSVLAGAVPAFAQISPLNKLTGAEQKEGKGASASVKEPSPSELRARVSGELREAEALRARLERGAASEGVPAGITLPEQEEKRRLVGSLVTFLQARLSCLDELEEVRSMHTATEREAASWKGFPEKPPYSILMIDMLRDSADSVQIMVDGLESSREILQRETLRQQDAVKRAEERSRLAVDAVVRARSAEETARATWRRDLAQLRARVAMASLAVGALRVDVIKERIAAARSELGLQERRIAEAGKNVSFTREDLTKVVERLRTERAKLDEELRGAVDRDVRFGLNLSSARRELEQARAESKPDDRRIQLLEAKVQAAQAWSDSGRDENNVLSSLIAINQGTEDAWNNRYESFSGKDPDKRRAALEYLDKSLKRIRPWIPYTQGQLKIFRTAERDQEQLLATLDADDPRYRHERDTFDALRLRRSAMERLNGVIEGIQAQLVRWQKDFQEQRASRSVGQLLADWSVSFRHYARLIWNFELFAVEDTVEVGGQKIITSRGVTVGKSAGAVILFFAGYLVVAFLGRRLQWVLVSRFGVNEQNANVMRRWLVAVFAFILLVLTLNLARIPLTVFAFLGGALAIGVGFGTQTLIKNFISGILLLIERKVRVGDIVEVEGVVGRVTEVDIRSSTVLGFDGVETLIPNASFLENKVTNWTHTSPQMRRVLRVGVAYGSPVQTVSEVLMECAGRHGLILNTPEPVVLFEDFGDNSLIFALYFWIEMLPQVNALKVASDLRFMIEKQFTEKGIIISFPQRDVHLDMVRPFKVQVVTDV